MEDNNTITQSQDMVNEEDNDSLFHNSIVLFNDEGSVTDSTGKDTNDAEERSTTPSDSIIKDPTKHPCYEILQTRKQVIKNKTSRINMIKEIVSEERTFLHRSLIDNKAVTDWYKLNTALSQNPRQWTNERLAQSLCGFDNIYSLSLDLDSRFEDTAPAPILLFTVYMQEVRVAATAMKKTIKNKRKKIGEQKGGIWIQDTINMSELKPNSFDTSLCSSFHCRHNFLLPIGPSATEINEHNLKCKNDHRIALAKWNSLSTSRRSARPKAEKSKSVQLACMCCRMNCFNSIDGSGCFFCEKACKDAKAAGRDDRPFFDKNFECTCPICKCQCNVVYFRDEGHMLARQTQIELEDKSKSKSQTTMNSFFRFKHEIANDVSKRIMENKGNFDDAMGMAACDLMNSLDKNEDNNLRLNLQEAIGPLASLSPDKSIAQLRRENRQKRKLSPSRELAHLPSDKITSVISPPAQKVMRYYNNRLGDGKNICDDDDVKMPGKIDLPGERMKLSSEGNVLKKRVMQRLIGVNSPPSDEKKKCFKKLVNGDDTAIEILNMAAESGDSVDNAKEMLMNYCID